MGTCRCLLGLYWGEHIGLFTRAPKKHMSKNKDGDIPSINPFIMKPDNVGISVENAYAYVHVGSLTYSIVSPCTYTAMYLSVERGLYLGTLGSKCLSEFQGLSVRVLGFRI